MATAKILASATRGSRAAALAPRVPSMGHPLGRTCARSAAAPLARHTLPYGQMLPFGTGVGGHTPRVVPSGGGGASNGGAAGVGGATTNGGGAGKGGASNGGVAGTGGAATNGGVAGKGVASIVGVARVAPTDGALAPRVPSMGHPLGRTCTRCAAAPLARHTLPYGQMLPFGTSVGGHTPRVVPSGGGGASNGGAVGKGGAGTGVAGVGGAAGVGASATNGIVAGTGGASNGCIAGNVGANNGLAPTNGVAPTDGLAPTDGVAPTDGLAPTDGVARTDGLAPTDGVAPTTGGGVPCSGGCRFDADRWQRMLDEKLQVMFDEKFDWLQHKIDETMEIRLMESVEVGDKLQLQHFMESRADLEYKLKSYLGRNLLLTLFGVLVQSLAILVVGACLGMWFVYNMLKKASDRYATEGSEMIRTVLDQCFNYLEERYPKLAWIVMSSKKEEEKSDQTGEEGYFASLFRRKKQEEQKSVESENKAKQEDNSQEKVEKKIGEKKYPGWLSYEVFGSTEEEEEVEKKKEEEKKADGAKTDTKKEDGSKEKVEEGQWSWPSWLSYSAWIGSNKEEDKPDGAKKSSEEKV